MKLTEIKLLVYQQSQAKTPKALKAKYPNLQTLDFRRKASWLTALKQVSSEPISYEEWIATPPAEYRDVFAGIQNTQAQFEAHQAWAENLATELMELANQLNLQAQTAPEAEKN